MSHAINSRVHLHVDIDGYPIPGELGTITVPIHDGAVALPDVRQALGELLIEAGAYLLSGGRIEDIPEGPQGVGVSESRD